MRIQKEKLLIVDGVAWFIAGVNVAAIGFAALLGYAGWKLALMVSGAIAVFTLFRVRIFSPMAKRNEVRIRAYDDALQSPLRFLDKRGFIIMGFMMLLGFGGRALGLLPEAFVAFFYPGLGFALAVTGFGFFLRYFGREWNCYKPLKGAKAR